MADETVISIWRQELVDELDALASAFHKEFMELPESFFERWRVRVARDSIGALRDYVRAHNDSEGALRKKVIAVIRGISHGWADAPPEFSAAVEGSVAASRMSELYRKMSAGG